MLYETDAGDLIEFAKAWAELGDAVAEQVADVVDNPQTDEVNPAAIELARAGPRRSPAPSPAPRRRPPGRTRPMPPLERPAQALRRVRQRPTDGTGQVQSSSGSASSEELP